MDDTDRLVELGWVEATDGTDDMDGLGKLN